MTHLHTCTWGQNKRMKSAGWVIQIVHATAVVLGTRSADCVVRQWTHCRTPLSLTQQGARFISLKWSTGENMPACSSYNKKRHGKRLNSQQNKNVFFLSYHCQNFFLKRVTICECLYIYWNYIEIWAMKKLEILLRLYSTKEHTAAFPLASNPAEEIS